MKELAWLRRLRAQQPGWHFWTANNRLRWNAVPAPADATLLVARLLPGRVRAATAAQLREAVRLRYGWDDTCQSCGVLARVCGHRQP